jgi:outer membrane protein
MNWKIKILTAFMCVLFGSLQLMAQDTTNTQAVDLSLSQAIEIALESNYGLKVFDNNIKIAENNVTLGNAGFLPDLNGNAGGNWQIENVDQVFLDGRQNSRAGARSNVLGASADLVWTVFDGLGMFRRYEQFAEIRSQKNLLWRQEAEFLIADVVLNYYQVVLESRKVEVLHNTLNFSKDRLKLARDRYELGKGSKLEFLQAQVDYNQDSSALMVQQNALLQSKINLNTLLARPPRDLFAITDSIPSLKQFDLVELRDLTLYNNSTLEILRKGENISLLEIQRIQAERWPRINVEAAYSYQKFESQAGFLSSNRTDGLNYGLRATVPIFNGSNINRRVQNARIQQKNTQLQIKQEMLNVNADLESNYTSYERALAVVQLERKNLSVAHENAEIAFERYRLGKSNPVELRQAQINAQNAETRLLDAVFAAKSLEIELIRLSGQLLQRGGETN